MHSTLFFFNSTELGKWLGESEYFATIKSWVQIPSPHVRKWAWLPVPVSPVLLRRADSSFPGSQWQVWDQWETLSQGNKIESNTGKHPTCYSGHSTGVSTVQSHKCTTHTHNTFTYTQYVIFFIFRLLHKTLAMQPRLTSNLLSLASDYKCEWPYSTARKTFQSLQELFYTWGRSKDRKDNAISHVQDHAGNRVLRERSP